MREDRRHLNTNSDSEVLLNVLAHELQRFGTTSASAADIFAAVERHVPPHPGGYAVVAMIIGHGIVGFRDPHGIRPLVLGMRETPHGVEHMVASESVALDQSGFELMRDVLPGRGRLHRQDAAACTAEQCAEPRAATRRASSSSCTSRGPIRSSTTSRSTRRACAWASCSPTRSCAHAPDHDIDVVIPIPDT